jgi:4'-phosphopantetheinyl transferase EntD
MIEKLLRSPVCGAEIFGDDPRAVLFPGEEQLIERAPQRRRREFATARACARTALGRLGQPTAAVLADDRGAPLWPVGVTGSITHCAGYRAAAVALARDVISLGLDAAPNRPMRRPDMLEAVARDAERARLPWLQATAPGVCFDQLLFSAKESVYKAWYPVAGRWLDFESADIEFGIGGTFSARLLVDVPPALAGSGGSLHGTWVACREFLLTAVVVPQTSGRPRQRTMNDPAMPIWACPGMGQMYS